MSTNNPILNGMATILWGTAWANHAEEHRCVKLSGEKIEEIMPEVPAEAYLLAAKFIGMLEQANGMNIDALMGKAAKADGEEVTDDLMEEFGGDLAYMVTGAGVSWFDDHEEFPLEVPSGEEYDLQILADETCEDSGRPRAKYCGHYCDPKDKKCRECGHTVEFEDED